MDNIQKYNYLNCYSTTIFGKKNRNERILFYVGRSVVEFADVSEDRTALIFRIEE
jgi:hypothetical protein